MDTGRVPGGATTPSALESSTSINTNLLLQQQIDWGGGGGDEGGPPSGSGLHTESEDIGQAVVYVLE